MKEVPCVGKSWEATAIEKEDFKNMRRQVAKYKGTLYRDLENGVWEDRVIIDVLWKSGHDQYMANSDLTSGMEDEAEYVISSVQGLIIWIFFK